MTKKALIILAEGFEEIEAITVIDILRRANITLTVAGLTNQKVTASRGTVVFTDILLSEAENDYDACILPGGMSGATNLAASEKVNAFIKKMYVDGNIIAAICASPAIVLAPTGILSNKAATCYPGMESHFDQTVTAQEDPVVIDGTVITSRGPGTALSFALALVEVLAGKEMRAKISAETLA